MPRNKTELPAYVAIDFETAFNTGPCACSVGLARFENGILRDEYYSLIRPPYQKVMYSWVHGLTWEDLETERDFAQVWLEMSDFIRHTPYLVAHNAPFDRRVLYGCCDYYAIDRPLQTFLCTLKGSRRALSIEKYNLEAVSGYFGFELDHHNAASDARNCGRIMAKLLKMGYSPAEMACGKS